jgi:hypothetical protein
VPRWNPSNPPSYNQPGQCPYSGRNNPLASGPTSAALPTSAPNIVQLSDPNAQDIVQGELCIAKRVSRGETVRARGQLLYKDPETLLCLDCAAVCLVTLLDTDGTEVPGCIGKCASGAWLSVPSEPLLPTPEQSALQTALAPCTHSAQQLRQAVNSHTILRNTVPLAVTGRRLCHVVQAHAGPAGPL